MCLCEYFFDCTCHCNVLQVLRYWGKWIIWNLFNLIVINFDLYTFDSDVLIYGLSLSSINWTDILHVKKLIEFSRLETKTEFIFHKKNLILENICTRLTKNRAPFPVEPVVLLFHLIDFPFHNVRCAKRSWYINWFNFIFEFTSSTIPCGHTYTLKYFLLFR